MNLIAKAATSFAIASALTLTGLRWRQTTRLGWFELDGRPVAIDGVPVADWQHANEMLARMAATTCSEMCQLEQRKPQAPIPSPEPRARQFSCDYVPAEGDGGTRRIVVCQALPGRVLWGGFHPIVFATYSIEAPTPTPEPTKAMR
jgi:hypothetical protein